MKYRKPFVCICKHTSTRICIYGRAAQLDLGSLPVSVFLALGFALLPMSYPLQFRQRPQPDPMTLDEYTPHQYWSTNFIISNGGSGGVLRRLDWRWGCGLWELRLRSQLRYRLVCTGMPQTSYGRDLAWFSRV